MRHSFCLVAFFGVLLANGSHARSLSQILASKRLVVGISHHDYPPYYFTNADGTLGGFDIEMAKSVGESLGVQVVFHRDPNGYQKFPQLLATNQIDVVIAAYRVSLARAKYVRFSKPYQSEKHVFVMLRKNESQFSHTLANIKKRSPTMSAHTTGLLKKTTFANFFETTYPASKIVTVDNVASLIAQLRNEAICLAYLEESVINHWLDNHPEDRLYLVKYFVPKEVDQIAFAVDANNEHFLSWLNLFLDDQKKQERLSALSAKYFGTTPAKSREL